MAMGQILVASSSQAVATKPVNQVNVLKGLLNNAQRLMAMLHREQQVHKKSKQEQHSPRNLQEIHFMVVMKAIAITVAELQQFAIVQRKVIQIVVLAVLASGQTFANMFI